MTRCPSCKSENVEVRDTNQLIIYHCRNCNESWIETKSDITLFKCQRCNRDAKGIVKPFKATLSYVDRKGYSHDISIELYLCRECLIELHKLIKRFVSKNEKK